MHVTRLCLLLIALIGLLVAETAAQRDALAPQYVSTSCPVSASDSFEVEGVTYECGLLTVFQRRNPPGISTLTLWVVRIFPPQPTGQSPVVYMAGGPGQSALDQIDTWLRSVLRQQHEIILIDPRGAGFSSPSLDCPEFAGSGFGTPAADCRQRLSGQNVDLTIFNTTESAADVADLLVALEIPQANLVGFSYGTRLALSVLRNYPERVRSVVLDAVVPPQINTYSQPAREAQRALDTLFRACRSDNACASAYPDLENAFYTLVTMLDRQPVQIQLPGTSIVLVYTGADLLRDVLNWLYDARQIPHIPQRLQWLIDGETSRYGAMLDSVSISQPMVGVSEGLYLNVTCREEIAFVDTERVLTELRAARGSLGQLIRRQTEALFAACIEWNMPAVEVNVRAPVVSGVPVLLMNGQFDPVVAPGWAPLAAETLLNHRQLLLPDTGHGSLNATPCADAVVLAFLANPLGQMPPCVDQLQTPQFVLPD